MRSARAAKVSSKALIVKLMQVFIALMLNKCKVNKVELYLVDIKILRIPYFRFGKMQALSFIVRK